MKRQWVLKRNLKELRDKAGLSMAALAEKAFTTNTTIFRIEKTGIVSDESLAQILSQVLEVSFEDLYLERKQEEEALAKWEANLKAVYAEKPDKDREYYLIFVIRHENGKSYQAVSPSYWVSMADAGSEWRELRQYYPDGVVEHLEEQDIKCAVIHDEMALIYFYYGLEDDRLTAALVNVDIARTVYPGLETKYLVRPEQLVDFGGFKDCVSLAMHDG